jgi:hypothetical protein
VNRFDVSVYAIRRRAGRRRPFEVRWQAAGRSRSKSFITRRLPDGYRKWPSLAAHSRVSVAEALATVTPALTRSGARDRPGQRELRMALYQHAFNPARPASAGSPAAQILDWAQQASLSVGCLSEPAVLRTALEALTLRLDGSRAAANTIIRKRAVLHGTLGYAVSTGHLPTRGGPGPDPGPAG